MGRKETPALFKGLQAAHLGEVAPLIKQEALARHFDSKGLTCSQSMVSRWINAETVAPYFLEDVLLDYVEDRRAYLDIRARRHGLCVVPLVTALAGTRSATDELLDVQDAAAPVAGIVRAAVTGKLTPEAARENLVALRKLQQETAEAIAVLEGIAGPPALRVAS